MEWKGKSSKVNVLDIQYIKRFSHIKAHIVLIKAAGEYTINLIKKPNQTTPKHTS